MKYLGAFLLLWIITIASAQDPWKKECVDGFELRFYKQKKSYNSAKSFCEDLGGHLAKVDDERITNVINSAFPIQDQDNTFYIGGNDLAKEGEWKWQDGTDVIMKDEKGYKNWKNNQPNGGTGENCLTVGRETYEWIDVSCDGNFYYICQKEVQGPFVEIQSTNRNQKSCYATECSTAKQVKWRKASDEVSTATTTTVYQTIQTGSAILYLQNANISDAGSYSCRNQDGQTGGTVEYAVDGNPTIHGISNNTCNSNLIISWKPHTNAVGFPHKVEVTTFPGGSPKWVESPTSGNQSTLISSLLPTTDYTIKITACVTKDNCLPKYSATKTATTGGATLSAESSSTTQIKENQTCVIDWTFPNSAKIGGPYNVEVNLTSYLATSRDSNKQLNTQTFNVTSSSLHSFQPDPNRNYSASIKIFNCVGASQAIDSSGRCTGRPKAPEKVSPLLIENNVINENGTKEMTLLRPNETNGLVSCMLVIVGKTGSEVAAKVSLDNLKEANKSWENGEYIAMAIPVSSMDEEEMKIILGDESETSCDVNDTGKKDSRKRKKRSAQDGNVFVGRSQKFNKEEDYKVSVVTSTPSGDDVYFSRSMEITLKWETKEVTNGEKGTGSIKSGDESGGTPSWTFAIIGAVVLILIVGIIITVVILKKRKNNETTKIEVQPSELENPVPPTPNVAPHASDNSPRVPPPVQPRRPISNEVHIVEGQDAYVNYVKKAEKKSETSISVSDLENVYNSMRARENRLFLEQFQKILQEAAKYGGTKKFASNEALKKKNRYKNILPFDDTRVPLTEAKSGYINACFINGHNVRHKYIATQGPLPDTVGDFWQMVLEQKSKVIVMLAKEIEAGKKKCQKYWPDAGKNLAFGDIVIENAQEVNYSAFMRRVLVVTSKQDNKSLTVYQYQFLKWPDHGAPQTTSNLLRMHQAVLKSCQDLENDSPIVVHCSAGAGRTGTFIGYDILLEESTSKRSVDVFSCVLNMRKQRVEMVQTADQYIILHKLMLETSLFGDKDLSTDEAKNKLEMMKSSGNAQSSLRKEFDDLSRIYPMKDSKLTGNEHTKTNRSMNVVPYDYSLAKLAMEAGETKVPFVNASWVESYDESSPMIASQGPTSSNIDLFWRSVLDNNVNTIVMLTELNEGHEEQCAQYWPSSAGEELKLQNIKVTLAAEETDAIAVTRKLKIDRGIQSRSVTQFHYTGWKSTSCPEEARGIIDLVSKMQKNFRSTGNGVILIHCR
uniref:uncharacterized protein LOC120335088 n=1 Tax=Styela clava TaxID=7725 RepID=UPI00193A6654|nr:uncharacterized protein LOC120335088 [Styela clava]